MLYICKYILYFSNAALKITFNIINLEHLLIEDRPFSQDYLQDKNGEIQ
jgi:hypothetical protein